MSSALQSKTRLSFRDMTSQDLADVVSIESAVHAYPWKRGHFADALKAGNATLVMELGREMVGYAIVMTVLDEAHLLNISIAKSHQRQGLGRKLLEQVVALAQSKQCKDLYLEVRESNQPAIALYESVGFNEMSIRRNYYPAKHGREHAILMGLAI